MDTEQIVKDYLDTLNINQDIKSLEDISTLAKAHLQTYAFGNPKILLGESVPIDLESVYNNLVVNKRAGYCFEHNKLMYEVLKAKGFEVTQHLARVVNNQSPPTIPMTHRVTVLYYQGEQYLVDVGVGFRSPTVVIKIGDTQPTLSHLGIEYNVLPVDADKNVYTMQLMEKNEPYNATAFDLIENIDADFEVGNFYCYMNPEGIWRNNLVVSCYGEDVIYSLRNTDYFKIYADHTEQVTITKLEHFIDIMQNELNVNYSRDELAQVFESYVQHKAEH